MDHRSGMTRLNPFESGHSFRMGKTGTVTNVTYSLNPFYSGHSFRMKCILICIASSIMVSIPSIQVIPFGSEIMPRLRRGSPKVSIPSIQVIPFGCCVICVSIRPGQKVSIPSIQVIPFGVLSDSLHGGEESKRSQSLLFRSFLSERKRRFYRDDSGNRVSIPSIQVIPFGDITWEDLRGRSFVSIPSIQVIPFGGYCFRVEEYPGQ